MPALAPAYRYRASCVRVIDGDSLVVSVDCGFHVAVQIHVRLADVNAPEMHGATRLAGETARAHLEDLMRLSADDGPLVVETRRDKRSFSRWVADVHLPSGESVADLMVAGGMAVRV